ncbi:MAG: hypothetical protein M3198_19210 [Actinomycetota bacterium]|nr:hypothetical protein [Actinomycetota bacterium]
MRSPIDNSLYWVGEHLNDPGAGVPQGKVMRAIVQGACGSTAFIELRDVDKPG